MKKLISILLLSMFLVGSVFAQQVTYSMRDGEGKHLEWVVYNYYQNGYEIVHEKGAKVTAEKKDNMMVVTHGDLVMTILVEGNYYHNQLGVCRTARVITSHGDDGVALMTYAGRTSRGRLYYEELWLNGVMVIQKQKIIDHNDHIVWSKVLYSGGTLMLVRM